jgi:hypothetical protein
MLIGKRGENPYKFSLGSSEYYHVLVKASHFIISHFSYKNE